jgi:hypothetical protein
MIDSPSGGFASRPNQFAAISACTTVRIDDRINQSTTLDSEDKTRSP